MNLYGEYGTDGFAVIVVVGGGTMGGGIAVRFALAGTPVRIVEHSPELAEACESRVRESLARAASRLGRGDEITDLDLLLSVDTAHPEPSNVELVIEALPEDLGLKQSILSTIDTHYFADRTGEDRDLIIGSNTSSLPISEIATSLQHPERFCGMHFFNPVPASSLVEVVVGEQTSDATVAKATSYGELLGLTPIVVKDSPGFASSRLGVALGLEAIRMVESGVASAGDIDSAMILGYKHPIGPLKLTDLVGVDVRLAIAEHLANELGPRFEPPELMRNMVAEQKLGKKTGEGFYVW